MKRTLPLVLPLLAACSNMPDLSASLPEMPDVVGRLQPYKIDVRQGNLVTQDMVAQLRPGQTKDQVRFILGTPLVTDVFHGDRWDYVYRLQYGTSSRDMAGKVDQRRLVVFFENGKLARVGGDVVGETPESAAAAAEQKPTARIIEIEAPKKAEPKKEEKKEEAKPAEPAPSN